MSRPVSLFITLVGEDKLINMASFTSVNGYIVHTELLKACRVFFCFFLRILFSLSCLPL